MTDPTPPLVIPPSDPIRPGGATTGAIVLSGGLWRASANLIPPLLVLVQSVVAARFLGIDAMGKQSYIAWTSLSLTLLFTGGMPTALIRYAGQAAGAGRGGQVRDLLLWAWRVEAVGALLGAGALVLIGFNRPSLQTAWTLSALTCALSVMQTVPSAILSGLQRWRDASYVGLVTGAVGTVALVLVLAAGGGIASMFAVEAVVVAANLIWASRLTQRALRDFAPDPEGALGLRHDVARYAVIASIEVFFTLVVWKRSEFFFLDRYSRGSSDQIALYSIAFSAVFALQALPMGLTSVLLPAVASLIGAGEQRRMRYGIMRAMRLTLTMSVPLAAGALALGPESLRLVYGEAFRGTATLVIVMAVALPIIMVSKVSSALLQGLGFQRLLLASVIAATILDVALAVWLVPKHQALGAAIANTAAQVLAAGLTLAFARRFLGSMRWEARSLGGLVVTSAVAAGVAIACVNLLPSIVGFVAGCLAFVACFLVLSRPLSVIASDDAQWLDQAIGTRLGGIPGRVARSFMRAGERAGA